MHTSDDGKAARGAYRIADVELEAPGETPPAPTRTAKPGEGSRPRGPYRISDEDMLKDPEVVAFREALRSIKDPEQRAALLWMVFELARTKRNRR